jgi:hypothetical protein
LTRVATRPDTKRSTWIPWRAPFRAPALPQRHVFAQLLPPRPSSWAAPRFPGAGFDAGSSFRSSVEPPLSQKTRLVQPACQEMGKQCAALQARHPTRDGERIGFRTGVTVPILVRPRATNAPAGLAPAAPRRHCWRSRQWYPGPFTALFRRRRSSARHSCRVQGQHKAVLCQPRSRLVVTHIFGPQRACPAGEQD